MIAPGAAYARGAVRSPPQPALPLLLLMLALAAAPVVRPPAAETAPTGTGLGQARAAAPATAAETAVAPAAPAATVAATPAPTPPASVAPVLEIVVPAGAAEGATLVVNSPDGQQLHVVVPAGAAPGSKMLVHPPPPPAVAFATAVPAVPAEAPAGSILAPAAPAATAATTLPHATAPAEQSATAPAEQPAPAPAKPPAPPPRAKLLAPDGGELVDLVIGEDGLAAAKATAATLPSIPITAVDKQWMHVLADGWASPLRGFMTEAEYLQCLHFGHLSLPDGTLVSQSVPIVLAVSDEVKEKCADAPSVALTYNDQPVAIMAAPSFYEHRKEEREGRTWGFTTQGIPYIDMIDKQGPWLVGGSISVLGREALAYHDGLDEYRKTPAELRQEFARRGADAVYAFQLRNPVHNGHALLMTTTRQQLLDEGYTNPVLLLHPLGGWTKSDDVPLDVRIRQHLAVMSGDSPALDPESTVLAIWPSPMSYSGPNEVMWHAKSRTAAGATHYIVGRDPAGMKHPVTNEDLYEKTHGEKVLKLCPGLKDRLKLVAFRPAGYDTTTGKMDFIDSARAEDFVSISGTKMRKYARGQMDTPDPPPGFMVPLAWEIVKAHYSEQQQEASASAVAGGQ